MYALDAVTGGVLWRTSLARRGRDDERHARLLAGHAGDRDHLDAGHRSIARSTRRDLRRRDVQGPARTYFQRLHALDLATRRRAVRRPEDHPGVVSRERRRQFRRRPSCSIRSNTRSAPALLLLNGRIITAWTSHCDIDPYTGWIMAYDADTLAQSSVLNITPNGSRGGFWMAGAGPAADPQGNIYLLDGNGTFDTTLTGSRLSRASGNFGNAFLKIATSGGLAVADYFATFDTVAAIQCRQRSRLGRHARPARSRRWHGPAHATWPSAPGKDGHIYVVDRDSMGKWNASSNQSYQDISGALGGSVFSMPAYFNNTVYYGAGGRHAQGVCRSRTPGCRRARHRQARGRSRIRGRLPASRRPATRMGLSGRSKTRIRRCCTPTMRGICRRSSTTRIRRRRPRPVRGRQQVHHADDRQRPGVCRHPERRRGVRHCSDRPAPTGLRIVP